MDTLSAIAGVDNAMTVTNVAYENRFWAKIGQKMF